MTPLIGSCGNLSAVERDDGSVAASADSGTGVRQSVHVMLYYVM